MSVTAWPRLRDLRRYRGVVFDLDGTLHLAGRPLPGAAAFVSACRASAARLAFATNSGQPTRDELVENVRAAGVELGADELLLGVDAVATAMVTDGVRDVACLGGAGLREAIARAGLTVRTVGELDPAGVADGPDSRALAVGIDLGVTMRDLGRAAMLLDAGLALYAATVEPRYPTDAGLEAGTGAMLAALKAMTGVGPRLCGKPTPAFAALVRERLEGIAPVLVVGDSMIADVPLATALGWDSLLVLTGSTKPADLDAAPATPTFVEPDLCTALTNGCSRK
jgi:HAD superfamily hydrolase (TIGR01450 family)